MELWTNWERTNLYQVGSGKKLMELNGKIWKELLEATRMGMGKKLEMHYIL